MLKTRKKNIKKKRIPIFLTGNGLIGFARIETT
jgi:hypothetical protein